MRHIDRLAEPGILTKKKAQWLADFLASGKNRPDSSKYGHKDILAALNNMSYNKCFYSEERLIAKPKNVDHLMEVALDKTKAFEWSNLYLSSPECNQGRPDNNDIPIADVLDPCKDSDAEIQAHITFDNELIQANNGSKKGLEKLARLYGIDEYDILEGNMEQVNFAYAFRRDGVANLEEVSHFQQIVKNYIMMSNELEKIR